METYVGHVRTPQDAIILFEACRLGQLPRVQRRLSEKERQLIKSGSVFVWDEREAGMRRWTDGKSWSASRVNGSFLTYREMEGKKGGASFPSSAPSTTRPMPPRASPGQDDHESGMGDAPDGYRYRPDGLTKQSFSITTSTNQHLHLISYFSRSDLSSGRLRLPSQDPGLRQVRPAKGMYPESTLQDTSSTPALIRTPMVDAHYAGSPHASAASTPQYAKPRTMGLAYSPNHNWPPSPMHTPPLAGTPSHFSPYPNGRHSGPSPLYPPGSAPHAMPPHHARVPVGPTMFDVVPPPMGAGTLPPAPGPGLQQAPPPGYPAHIPTSVPQHYPPPASYPHSTPPAHYSPQTNQLAPFRNSNSPHAKPDAQYGPHPPPDPRQSAPTHEDNRTPPRSSAGTIPSIGALINKDPSPGADRQQPHPLSHRHSVSNKRPGESNLGGFPEKKPYTEDTRALRQLDRAFAA